MTDYTIEKAEYKVVRKAMYDTCRPSNIRGYANTARSFGWDMDELFAEVEARGEVLTPTEYHLQNFTFRINSSFNIG